MKTDEQITTKLPNETRLVGKIEVHRYRIIGTSTVVYAAYEPSSLFGRHFATMSSEFRAGATMGEIQSLRIPAEIEALPGGSDERIAACRAWRTKHCQRAYDAILAAFPEAADGVRREGEIEIVN